MLIFHFVRKAPRKLRVEGKKSVKDNEIGWDDDGGEKGSRELEDDAAKKEAKKSSQRVFLKCSLNQIQSRATTHKKKDNQSFRKGKLRRMEGKSRFTFSRSLVAAASLSFSRIFPMTLSDGMEGAKRETIYLMEFNDVDSFTRRFCDQ